MKKRQYLIILFQLNKFLMRGASSEGTKLSQIPHHSQIEFSQPNQPSIIFSSKFDSGNMNRVIRNCYEHYSIWTASDAQGTQFVGYPKSWFYFRVAGFKNRKVVFSVHRVHFLWAMINRSHLYRPVYRTQPHSQPQDPNPSFTQWKRLPNSVHSISINSQQQLVLKFDFFFDKDTKFVEFAFIYPYSHEECRNDIESMKEKYSTDDDVFFKQYQLCRSSEGRLIDLIVVSSHQGKDGVENVKTDGVFTLGDKKIVKFRNNKPIIFISARVHPIQTPSSYTMTGIINFLLDKNDYRAHLLRKYFVFVLVPMLNPDGVSNGHCRMDSLNQNLNRYYNNPDPIKQPSCYSVIKLCQHYSKDQRLFMYLDLHAHPANKGNFIFGNAIFDYIEQVQSHLFPKILSQNCINFQFEQCNFSRKHMKAKDRYEDMNKQGCGRVVFYKQFGITHSYTLQCGYHCNTYNNELKQQQNQNQIFIVRYRRNDKNENIFDNYEQSVTSQAEADKLLESLKQKKNNNTNYRKLYNIRDKHDNIQDEFYKKLTVFFEQETFYNLGRNICISILDIWNKNPYTRISNLNEQRKQIAEKQAKLDRFRKQQVGIKTKQKRIVELIESQFYAEWHKKNIFLGQGTISNGFKKLQLKTSINKRVQKSLTINEQKQQNNEKNKIKISKSITKVRNWIKEQKKIEVTQQNVESIKIIPNNGTKNVIESKTFFRPVNLRLRNLYVQNSNK